MGFGFIAMGFIGPLTVSGYRGFLVHERHFFRQAMINRNREVGTAAILSGLTMRSREV